MINFGDVPAGSVLPVFFGSYGKTDGDSITLSGLATSDIEIYKGISTTQRSSDAGYTLMDTDGIDVDGLTGIHGFSIDTGDNSDSGFYSVGDFFTVVVSSVTVDTEVVNFIAATFRIVAAQHTAGYPVVTIKDGTGTGEIDTTSGGVLVAAIAANAITATSINADAITAAKVASDVSAEIADAVWDEDATGHQTGGTFGQAIGDPGADTTTIYAATVTGAAGTHIAADIIAVKAETASILSDTNAILVDTGTTLDGKINTIDGIVDDILLDTAEIGAAGAGLTNINLPDQTMNITGNITGNLSGSVGSVTGNVGGNVAGNVTGTIGGLTAAALKDFFDTDSTTTYGSAVAGSVVKEIADNAGGASLTVQDIVDGVWDEPIAAHSGVAGSTAEQLAAAGAAGDPWATALPGAYGAGTAGKIVGDNINATISSRASQASVDTVDTNVDAILDDTGTSGVIVNSINADAVNASALAANAVTELQSGLATAAALATVDGKADAIKAKTDDLTFSVANQVNVNIKSVADTTVTGSGTAGDPWGPA